MTNVASDMTTVSTDQSLSISQVEALVTQLSSEFKTYQSQMSHNLLSLKVTINGIKESTQASYRRVTRAQTTLDIILPLDIISHAGVIEV